MAEHKQGGACRRYRVVFVGKTGTGKSRAAGKLCDPAVFPEGDDPVSVTQEPSRATARFVVDGENVELEVFDMPGLFDTRDHEPEQHAARLVQNTGRLLFMAPEGVDALVYTISKGRFTAEDQAAVQLFLDSFFPGIVDNIMLLFTRCEPIGSFPGWLDKFKREELGARLFRRVGTAPVLSCHLDTPAEELRSGFVRALRRFGGRKYTQGMFQHARDELEERIAEERNAKEEKERQVTKLQAEIDKLHMEAAELKALSEKQRQAHEAELTKLLQQRAKQVYVYQMPPLPEHAHAAHQHAPSGGGGGGGCRKKSKFFREMAGAAAAGTALLKAIPAAIASCIVT